MKRLLSILLLTSASPLMSQDPKVQGYTDTPLLPGSPYRVHDRNRPHPPVVEPPPPTPAPAPKDAIILFDGTSQAAFTGGGGEAKWLIENGELVVNGTGDIRTLEGFGDVQFHIEWASPGVIRGDGQGRGNSGVFFMDRYEVQILDSFRNPTYADGQAAALYGQHPPLCNASRPPGEWQSLDIVFRAPVFEGERLVKPARATVIHNGLVVHNNQSFLGSTTHKSLPRYKAHPAATPLRLQDHGDPVRFRNIWIRRLDGE